MECGTTKTWLIVMSVYAGLLTGAVIGYLLLAFLRRKVCIYLTYLVNLKSTQYTRGGVLKWNPYLLLFIEPNKYILKICKYHRNQ